MICFLQVHTEEIMKMVDGKCDYEDEELEQWV